MKVLFRTDASLVIGSGHVMRCLTLADELRSRGADIVFVCREHPGNLCSFIEGKGYTVHRLPYSVFGGGSFGEDNWLGATWEDDAEQTSVVLRADSSVDWLVVDHYSLNTKWEKTLKPLVQNIMVIDDLADREHDCDLLLDQNYYVDLETRYDHLVPQGCQKMLGPGYALLRSEFREARMGLKQRDGVVRRILLFFGGSDPTNETAKTLTALKSLNLETIAVDVVVGTSNPFRNEVRQLCQTFLNVCCHCQVSNMAELMVRADLSVGAGGATTWERCCLGLPAIVIAVAQNQIKICEDTATFGATKYLGTSDQISVPILVNAVSEMIGSRDSLIELSLLAQRLVDGEGVNRVIKAMGVV